MTDKGTIEKHGMDKVTDRDFFKPYRIKPVEVYVEPGPGGCVKDKNS